MAWLILCFSRNTYEPKESIMSIVCWRRRCRCLNYLLRAGLRTKHCIIRKETYLLLSPISERRISRLSSAASDSSITVSRTENVSQYCNDSNKDMPHIFFCLKTCMFTFSHSSSHLMFFSDPCIFDSHKSCNVAL